jgi:hypothetical protein
MGGAPIGGLGGAGMAGGGNGGGASGAGNCGATGCCFKVAPFGDDAYAEETLGATPFQSVQAAIDFADEHRELGTRICVAGGPACQPMQYPGPIGTDLRMRSGISVVGGFESSSYTRCSSSIPVTTLRPGTAAGVVFDADVQSETTLEGIAIRPDIEGTRTACVTVRGASGVRLVSLHIDDGLADEWHGIDLIDSEATIMDVAVYAQRSMRSVGVHAFASRVDVQGTLEMRVTSGIWLENSPGSRIAADVTIWNSANGVRITGDADGTRVSDSSLRVSGTSDDITGFSFEDCADKAPFLSATIAVDIENGSSADGVRSRSCHPRIENSSITVRGNGSRILRGVSCGSGNSGGSRCVLINDQIRTVDMGILLSPGISGTGVWCGRGSCELIESSTIVGLELQPGSCYSSCSYQAIGVDLEGTNTRVRGNEIRAGCGDRAAGIRASGISAEAEVHLENNTVYGRTTTGECGSVVDNVVASAGLLSGGNIDVRSNTFDGGGSTMSVNTCTSAAVLGGYGEYTGNTFRGGVCPESLGFSNAILPFDLTFALGAPDVLIDNDFATVRYRTDFTTFITTIEEINRLPNSSGNH